MEVGALTGDRVEAAAKAAYGYANAFMGVGCSWDDATEVMRRTWRENSRRALAAADEADRVAGVVRLDTRDNNFDSPTVERIAAAIWAARTDEDPSEFGPSAPLHLASILAARVVLDALGAAGVGEQGDWAEAPRPERPIPEAHLRALEEGAEPYEPQVHRSPPRRPRPNPATREQQGKGQTDHG